jgi:hypothetical protein
MIFGVGCNVRPTDFPDEAILATQFEWKDTATPSATTTHTPNPVTPTVESTATLEPVRGPRRVWVSPAVPNRLQVNIHWGSDLTPVRSADVSDLQLVVLADWETVPDEYSLWVYALVAPFPTLLDEVSLDELQAAWRGNPQMRLSGRPILMEESTRLAFQSAWGPADQNVIQVAPAMKY